jgi:hypothetical protein
MGQGEWKMEKQRSKMANGVEERTTGDSPLHLYHPLLIFHLLYSIFHLLFSILHFHFPFCKQLPHRV